MPDWDYINGCGDDYGNGDQDHDIHDPAGHCGPSLAQLIEGVTEHQVRRDTYIGRFACRHCGAPHLYWQRRNGRWLPFSRETLAQHVCPKPDNRNEEGFDDVG